MIIKDGTYTEPLIPPVSGTSGNPITFQAEHRGLAIIQPSSNNHAISVYSTASVTRAYLTFDGLIARGRGENSAISLASDDNVTESQMTNNIIIKNNRSFRISKFDQYCSHWYWE